MADTETVVFRAQPRTQIGKGAARAARRGGAMPAIIYGANKDPLPISINPHQLRIELGKPGFFATMYDIECDGQTEQVLCRDLQVHPVTDIPMHADFLRVTEATQIDVEIPVHFLNEEECPGIKVGGVLNIVRHTVEVTCRAGNIPESIVIDLISLEIGDSVHISEIDLPDGVRPTITDRDFTIATIAPPTVIPVEEEEAEEGLEGEEGVEAAEGEEEAGEGESGGDSDED